MPLIRYRNIHYAKRRCSEEAHFLGLLVLSLPEGEGERPVVLRGVLDNHHAIDILVWQH